MEREKERVRESGKFENREREREEDKFEVLNILAFK